MTLNDFWSMNYYLGKIPATAIVFDDIESIEDYVKAKRGEGTGDYTLLFALHSDRKAETFLKEEYANATVTAFTALGENRIAICIDMESVKK